MRQVWPLALMLCADRVPNKTAHFRGSALTQAGSPDPRNNRICITSSCPRQLVLPIYLPACLCRQQKFRLLVSLAPDHDGPGHPRDLVGERNGSHFRGSALHQPAEPGPPLGAVLARVADNGHCADNQQPPQISIALHGRTIHSGQKRRFDIQPATSGLPRSTDIARPVRLVRLVPKTEIYRRGCRPLCSSCGWQPYPRYFTKRDSA